MIDLNDVRDAGLFTGFASLTGGLSYFVQVQEGKKFSCLGFLVHFCVSAVAGFITYLILHYMSTPPDLSGALCGIAGWMGTRMMRIFELLIYRRYGVDPKDANSSRTEKPESKESGQ